MKILIYMPEDNLKPIGGPSGYLHNLYTGLNEIGDDSVDFLPPLGQNRYLTALKLLYHKIPNKPRTRLMNFYKKLKKAFVSTNLSKLQGIIVWEIQLACKLPNV